MGLALELDHKAGGRASMPIEPAQPLVLDLDGTLLYGDLLFESAAVFIRQNPLHLFLLAWWLLHGIAALKAQLAARINPAVDVAPFNEQLMLFARAAHQAGRPVVLATASHRALADAVAKRFPFVTDVLASTDSLNLKGHRKADALAIRYPQGYLYAGDAIPDLAIWKRCQGAIYAGRRGSVERRLAAVAPITATYHRPHASLRTWIRTLRLHQWMKNSLVFIPLLLAGHVRDAAALATTLVGFVAMGLMASATYLINDILDVEDDRRHATKRDRAIAAGLISIPEATLAAGAILSASLGLIALCGLQAATTLLAYCGLTLAYSFRFKRVPLLDVVALATLFTLRLVLGTKTAEVPLSAWLGAFSMMLFGSLALAKRATELVRHGNLLATDKTVNSRGYVYADLPLITSLGAASTVGAAIIMILYLINEAFRANLYSHPELLWGVPLLVVLGLGRVWLLCGRGALHDDPVSFAIHDRTSLCMAAALIALFGLAAVPAFPL